MKYSVSVVFFGQVLNALGTKAVILPIPLGGNRPSVYKLGRTAAGVFQTDAEQAAAGGDGER